MKIIKQTYLKKYCFKQIKEHKTTNKRDGENESGEEGDVCCFVLFLNWFDD